MAEKGKSTYYRSRELLVGAISYIVLIILSIFFFYPIFWMVDLSIMPKAEVFRLPPRYLAWPSLSSYIKVVTMWEFTKYLMNSVITSSTSVILSLLLGVPCAYVISRYDFPGRQNSAFFILSFRFLPPVAVAIPFYILYTYQEEFSWGIVNAAALLICVPLIVIFLILERYIISVLTAGALKA